MDKMDVEELFESAKNGKSEIVYSCMFWKMQKQLKVIWKVVLYKIRRLSSRWDKLYEWLFLMYLHLVWFGMR